MEWGGLRGERKEPSMTWDEPRRGGETSESHSYPRLLAHFSHFRGLRRFPLQCLPFTSRSLSLPISSGSISSGPLSLRPLPGARWNRTRWDGKGERLTDRPEDTIRNTKKPTIKSMKNPRSWFMSLVSLPTSHTASLRRMSPSGPGSARSDGTEAVWEVRARHERSEPRDERREGKASEAKVERQGN